MATVTGNVENGIEFIRGSDRATVSFSQGRHISRIKKLAAGFPDECKILAENEDGSICAHIPVAWVKIIPARQLTEEQREQREEAIRRNIFDKGALRKETG